jgi:nitroimidazol reductase NimA-like FMN-containing flavoprotein (pyridoxamine 5'-phosphate oxidase superfamily)
VDALQPLVCVELNEVVDGDHWMSVLVFGRYEELPPTPEWEEDQLRAHALPRQHAVWWEPGCASRHVRHHRENLVPIYYRVAVERVTGRRARPEQRETLVPGKDPPGSEDRG